MTSEHLLSPSTGLNLFKVLPAMMILGALPVGELPFILLVDQPILTLLTRYNSHVT